jgi:mRNA deadenylase 3'-5' endonuclease subunit Ccr4
MGNKPSTAKTDKRRNTIASEPAQAPKSTPSFGSDHHELASGATDEDFTLDKFLPPGFVGITINPRVFFEGIETPDNTFTWYRQISDTEKTPVGDKRAYTPVPEDVDHVLVFEVTAKYKNGKVLTKSTTTKEAAKALQTPPARTEWILHKDSTETEREHLIKLCTYNILAPIWTNPANCDWCPAWALEWSYRRAIILKELLAYDADIICLQEVDNQGFEKDLHPELAKHEYEGIFKENGSREGTAIFWRRKRFGLVDSKSLTFNDTATSPRDETDLYDKIKERLKVIHHHNVAQLLLLKEKSTGKHIAVANTHLYWGSDPVPLIYQLQIIQVSIIMQELQELLSEYKLSDENSAILFTGDFNSTLENAVQRFLKSGKVETNEAELVDGYFKGTIEKPLTIPYTFNSSYEQCGGEPKFTMYTKSHQKSIDYIYFNEKALKVHGVLDISPEETYKENQFIPSVRFPSDHIALVSSFKWNDGKQVAAHEPKPIPAEVNLPEQQVVVAEVPAAE